MSVYLLPKGTYKPFSEHRVVRGRVGTVRLVRAQVLHVSRKPSGASVPARRSNLASISGRRGTTRVEVQCTAGHKPVSVFRNDLQCGPPALTGAGNYRSGTCHLIETTIFSRLRVAPDDGLLAGSRLTQGGFFRDSLMRASGPDAHGVHAKWILFHGHGQALLAGVEEDGLVPAKDGLEVDMTESDMASSAGQEPPSREPLSPKGERQGITDPCGGALALLRTMTGDAGSRFRSGQLEAIQAIVEQRRRGLVVQRTGWSKSTVYFIATKLLRDAGDGPTLLGSPSWP
jgi:hypothetical protein